jgi:molybdopterin-containing oxidoreductase family membrane subunit
MRPVSGTGRTFYLLLGLSLAMFALYAYTLFIQFTQGHGTATNQSTPVGVVWGMYVASIVFFIGISHVGIGVSAATRLLNLDYLKPYARMAEMLTLVCLPAAVLMIVLDIGKPESFLINVLRYGRYQAPFVWSATVISVYLVASLVYLYLSMRRDIALTAEIAPRGKRFYRILALGYEDTEEQREFFDRSLWWLVLGCQAGLVQSLHGPLFCSGCSCEWLCHSGYSGCTDTQALQLGAIPVHEGHKECGQVPVLDDLAVYLFLYL